MFNKLVRYRYRLLPPVFLLGLGFPSFFERTDAMDVLLSLVSAMVFFTAWLARARECGARVRSRE